MSDYLPQLDAATKDADVKELSDDLVRKLKVLVNDAFEIARSDGIADPELLVKTINAFTALRGKLAPPATSGNSYPVLNFQFVVGDQRKPLEVIEVVSDAEAAALEAIDAVIDAEATPITFTESRDE